MCDMEKFHQGIKMKSITDFPRFDNFKLKNVRKSLIL